ncbi:TetR family transcriptional regulator C-terminal domain-containing protein [Poritiphilus flavus]|uniref:TetR/AcrR family transcriptional regulator n=1 Tax=Poritiphilus flavus TaxID=2697053 RepID=A0A6L9EAS7_9FLAO|nr:TetR/AcrR family transcriptional regulator [Poritiphilus flavus]NAS11846.1 TetR/AcrR family transcriptional regulator [Poritiphilus flavus]
MATKAAAKKDLRKNIISAYMEFVLENETRPRSVFKFCKLNNIKEEDFYKHFGSIEGLEKEVWQQFYHQTSSLLEKNEAYESYSSRDKMLSFFFTFFELLTLNRSYALFALGSHKNTLSSLEQLSVLRRSYKDFVNLLISEDNAEKNLKITKYNPKLLSEAAWLQFLFLLKFWIDDSSAGFEKTDLAIEKSVNTIFDVFDNTPLERIVDLGKFLFKERFA